MINADIFTPLIIKDDLIDNSTQDYLRTRMENFKPVTSPGDTENYYYREYIQKEEQDLVKTFLDNLYSILKKDFFYPHVELVGMWLNKVDNTANHNDDFHRDISKFSSVTFLNDGFDGGNLEYWDIKTNTPVSLKLQPFSTLIFEGSKYSHRVLPVKQGIRYTLITFWDIPRKDSKTLL